MARVDIFPVLYPAIKDKDKGTKTIEVMYFSLSENDKRYVHPEKYIKYNPNRHLAYSGWLKNQCLTSYPKVVHLRYE